MKLNKYGNSSWSDIYHEGKTIYFSYSTPVAFYDSKTHEFYVTDKKWSKTTTKHINELINTKKWDYLLRPQLWFDELTF